jgi:hypothetical protein
VGIVSTTAGTVKHTMYSAPAGTHSSSITNNLSDNVWPDQTAITPSVHVIYKAVYANGTSPSFAAHAYNAGTSKIISAAMTVTAYPQ